MELFIVILIVGVAVFFSTRYFLQTAQGKNNCTCNGSCDLEQTSCEGVKDKSCVKE